MKRLVATGETVSLTRVFDNLIYWRRRCELAEQQLDTARQQQANSWPLKEV